MTDSDDDHSWVYDPAQPDVTEPPDRLRYYEVQWSELDGRWYMLDYYGYDDIYISEVAGLARRFDGEGAAATKYTEKGDWNQVHDQGQTIVENCIITDSEDVGILVSAVGVNVDSVVTPQSGPTAPLANVNSLQQVPGTVIQNNIVANFGQMGIYFGGYIADSTNSMGSVPFGRITNNTIYGPGTTTQNYGIAVGANASPTILNNVIANTQTGIGVDYRSTTTVVGTTAYWGNETNLAGDVTETFAVVIGPDEPLFVDAAAGNFYPAAGSRIIDSSLDSLQDRENMITVKNPLGLPLSPILAPTYDILGQLRMDDPNISPPTGFGLNTYKDRGAIDRVDFEGTTAYLVAPTDNDAAGIDRNPTPAEVMVSVIGNTAFPDFIIQLRDDGAGVFDSTVLPEYVTVARDGVELVEGRDYYFTYESTNDQIILRSAGGAWAPGSTYLITLTDGIRDRADNQVQYTRPNDTTSFVVTLIGYDFGDAPMADTHLPDGARHIVIPDVHLGALINSEPTPKIDSFATGDDHDDGVEFLGGDYVVSQAGETKTIIVTASAAGVLDAWIDWDQSGVWDASEKLAFYDASGNPVTGVLAGENELTFDVPAGLVASGYFHTFARFRFSTTGLLSDGSPMLPTGEALDGEVEDYRITVAAARTDWGDAPDPTYPTLQESDGAYHIITSDALYLGESVSFDLLPQPDATASGDDDDGFDFSEVSLIQDRETTLTFQVANETGKQAYLHAWIDFNGDGVWSGGEKLPVLDVGSDSGEKTLTFTVPAGAALGQTFARFRLATQQTLLPTGGAIDGEVEDYMVNIEPTPGNILGFVYNDLDGDGVRDLDETGLEGWTIYIDANTNGQFDDGELSTVTAWDGSYEFIDLPPDTYVVRQVARGGWTQTGPAAGYYSIDVASNATVPDVNFFNQDTVPPAVVSITRGDGIEPAGQRTNAETVKFVVQFSEPVNGVDLDDFDFEAFGLPDVAIVSIDALDYDLYVVTVATGQGAGPLQLTLIDDDSIVDFAGHPLGGAGIDNGDFLTGESYIIDRSAPKAVSIELVGDILTNADTVTFTVTFNENVTGVDIDDFELAETGLTGADIVEVAGDGAVYTVTATTGEGHDFLGLNLIDNDTILDLAGNALAGEEGDDGSLVGPAYEIDRIAPQVESILPAGPSPTSDTTVFFTVVFTEPVVGVDALDFSLAVTGLNGSSITGVIGGGNTYTVAVKTGLGSTGTLQLNLIDDNTIRDTVGNVLVGPDGPDGSMLGGAYEIDRTKPTGIYLSNDRVAENMPINTVVGVLSSTGPNAGNYTYQLVAGDGSQDNYRFFISGGVLRTRESFTFNSLDPTYSIRIRTTDSAGKWLEKEFEITIVAAADTVTIGDMVWRDDGDGVQEAGESGVAGATVELICAPNGIIDDSANYTYAQAVTDSDGIYRFDYVLPDQSYYLIFRAPVG
ncbi:MAG: hypothetical protein GX594_02975, partial [Pirellulaceae bacterium]|nr:hypothetical protein [Pirellulaceae bacterium]